MALAPAMDRHGLLRSPRDDGVVLEQRPNCVHSEEAEPDAAIHAFRADGRHAVKGWPAAVRIPGSMLRTAG